ncbi:TOM (translocase of outer membrane) complex component [Komagataella phaffii CBS 7435]|uniref:Component (70 kDa) of the TOM (Translocase of outer membrane) complex n=2 Tax=Komagataella phaffii TaxID=460519 RepID=C4R211_KOMPG|nr:Component (70 kDa) of the TOM (translocase of outer membrane) complex [Komagataella phaffii GS115]AOA61934.1 GQ67_00955T0 [Komagataella phaffii]CAH2447920.1 TOM (translocase of outer membrane) complex component [Komagataella phaffii CBS 7435]AOA67936.1 GQ68_00434T0 [Komagataella phaffii GS115]CAY69535.1 Component (70 kDa) of the TOM (translocase of outer membrane) complex [Komagataella phaffii GS115]CCA38084.1 TOM (translocase of outer membrane) complex component [Komagataella phaffii CBS 7
MSDQSFWNSTVKFVSSHKAVITLTTIAGASTLAYLYYATNATSKPDSSATGSSKNKKKKSKKQTAPETSNADAPYPVDNEGKPQINEEIIGRLTEDEKNTWAQSLKETGNRAFKSDDYETALEYYNLALLCKKDPAFYSNSSACWACLGDNQKVIEFSTKALELKPDYAKCLMRRAAAYEKIEEYEKALYDLTVLTIYESTIADKSIQSMLERILTKQANYVMEKQLKDFVPQLPSASSIASLLGSFTEDSVSDVFGTEIPEDGSGDKFLYEALQDFKTATADSYEHADVALNQAVSKYADVTVSSDETTKRRAAMAYEYLGQFYFLKNVTAVAQEHLKRAIELSPRPRSHVILALTYIDKDLLNEAEVEFQKAMAINANDPDIYYQRGQLSYLRGDLANASENFETCKRLNPKNVYAYIQLACISYREGKIEEAVERFVQAKRTFPTSPEVPNYYGEILVDKNDTEDAIKQFDIAIKLQRSLSTVSIGALGILNKATILARRNEFPQAIELLEEAIQVDPKSELAAVQLAQIKLQLNQAEEAIVLFEKTAKLARSPEEKQHAISFAEAAKIQARVKKDPALSKRVEEIIAQAQGHQNEATAASA